MMFKKLKKRIVWHVMLLSLSLTTLICALSFIFTYVTLNKNFKMFAAENFNHALLSLDTYLGSTSASMDFIAANPDVCELLESDPSSYNLTITLKAMYSTLSGVSSVSLFAAGQNAAHIVGNVASYPALAALTNALSQSDGFFDGAVTLRNRALPATYNFNKYPEELGLITIVRFVKDASGQTVGYMFADILPSYVYNKFFTGAADLTLGVRILSGGVTVNSGDDAFAFAPPLGGSAVRSGFLYLSKPFAPLNAHIAVRLSRAEFKAQITALALILSAAFLVINALSLAFALLFARKTTRPLERLKGKMDKSAQEGKPVP